MELQATNRSFLPNNVSQANEAADAFSLVGDNFNATEFLLDIVANVTTESYDFSTTEPQSTLYRGLKMFASVMNIYFMPVITIAGTIGNILSVLVFFGTKLKKLSSSYYLAFLAIFDTGFLWCNFIQWMNFLNINLYERNGFCQLFTWLSNACSVLSVWLVVAFTIERFVAVLYPLKRPTLCTVRRARCIIFYLVVFNAITSSPLILVASSEYSSNLKNHLECMVHRSYGVFMEYYNYYDFFVAFLIPLTLIISLNSVTAGTVWKLARVRRSMTTHKRKKGFSLRGSTKANNRTNDFTHCTNETDLANHSMRITTCTHLNGHHSIRQSCPRAHRQRISNSSQMKVTKMLLIVSTVYILLNLPSYVTRVWIFLVSANGSNHWHVLMQHVSQIFFVSNFSINFVLYCMSGQNFRNELIGLFKRRQPQKLEFQNTYRASERVVTESEL